MNAAQAFLRQAELTPEKRAIVEGGRRITFGALAARSDALARDFREQGLSRGDVVLLLLPVGISLYATVIALLRLGAVILFPDPSAGIGGLRAALAAVPVKGLVSQGKLRLLSWFLPFLWPIPLRLSPSPRGGASLPPLVEELAKSAPALVTFTSGTTGRPKGISRSHGFLVRQHALVEEMLQPAEGEVDLISLPVFVLSNLGSGVTSVIPDGDLGRPGEIAGAPLLRQIEAEGVTRILAPPALLERLVETGAYLPGIAKVFTGGGPVFPDLLRRLAAFAPKAQITAVYGSTEAEPIAHIALSEIGEADFAAMAAGQGLLTGKPIAQIKLRLIEDEIVVSGDHVIKGYIDPADDPSTKLTLEGDIWHRTGDAGRLDEAGRLWLLGRIGARHQGRYPFALETAARALPGVRQAAFLAVEDKATLAIVAEGTADRGAIADALQGLAADLSVTFLPDLPMDRRHNSKVDRNRLSRQLSGHRP
jgi:acyl-CoA synthetase (AMP-forming)/AMP-acid ligase II